MNKQLRNLALIALIGVILNACIPKSPLLKYPGVSKITSRYGMQNPIWSPDNSRIATTSVTAGVSWTSEIFIIDLSDRRIKSIEKTESGHLIALSWHPNGNQLLFSSELGGNWSEGIWTIDVDGNNMQFLAEGYDATWSPDGKKLAVFSRSEEQGFRVRTLAIVDLETGTRTVIFSKSSIDVTTDGLSWSPGGEEILFTLGEKNYRNPPAFEHLDLYIINVETGKLQKITDSGENTHGTWSPDSTFISYIKNDTPGRFYPMLYISTKDGLCNKKILDDVWSASWSPDGEKIAIYSGDGIFILNLTITFEKQLIDKESFCSSGGVE